MKKIKKTFDAVAESRRWRAEASQMLDAMDLPTRLAFLAGLRTRPPVTHHARHEAGYGVAVVREDSP